MHDWIAVAVESNTSLTSLLVNARRSVDEIASEVAGEILDALDADEVIETIAVNTMDDDREFEDAVDYTIAAYLEEHLDPDTHAEYFE